MKRKTLLVAILSIALILTMFSAYSIREAQAEDINIRGIYKLHQNDPKWAKVLLDNCQTTTIGSDGCSLTAWTMLINKALTDNFIFEKGPNGELLPPIEYTPEQLNDLLNNYRHEQAVDKDGNPVVDQNDPNFDHMETWDGWNVPIDPITKKAVKGKSKSDLNIGNLLAAVEADTKKRSFNNEGLKCTNFWWPGRDGIGEIPDAGVTLDRYGFILEQLRAGRPVIVRTHDNKHTVIITSFHTGVQGQPDWYDIQDTWIDLETGEETWRLDDPAYGNKIWSWDGPVFKAGGMAVPYTVPSPYYIDPEHLYDPVANPGQYGLQRIEPSFSHSPQDIAITNLAGYKTVVGQGYNITINVPVINQGYDIGTFDVTAYYWNGTFTPEQWNAFGDLGDCNKDGYINQADVNIIAANWGWMGPPGENPADINSDGKVDMLDMTKLVISLGKQIWKYFLPVIDTQTIVDLTVGDSVALIFKWNTTGVAYGNYTITAVAGPIDNETYTLDNNCTCSTPVHVGVPGDISGPTQGVYDGIVSMRDIAYMIMRFNTRPGESYWKPNVDVNNDDVVNMRDIAIAIINFNRKEINP